MLGYLAAACAEPQCAGACEGWVQVGDAGINAAQALKRRGLGRVTTERVPGLMHAHITQEGRAEFARLVALRIECPGCKYGSECEGGFCVRAQDAAR